MNCRACDISYSLSLCARLREQERQPQTYSLQPPFPRHENREYQKIIADRMDSPITSISPGL